MKKKGILIGIAGGSGSGKTLVAETIYKDLGSDKVILLKQDSYYKDLIVGKVLQPLKITTIPQGGFKDYMKSQGKLGGQNKIPRLSDNRKIADALLST